MWIVAVVMIVTALWIILGAVVHDGRATASDVAGEAWWWEACDRSSPAVHQALPPSHPLARSSQSIG